jgi:plastocyanin
MLRTLLIAVVAVAAVSIPTAATGSSSATPLTGVVGPTFNISLKNADGTGVTHLDVGTYDITVTDNSIEHNFHLQGPGVDQKTDVEATGTVTWSVTITDGIYTFICDAHPTQMKGAFAAGTAQLPPPPPPPPPPASARKLSGKVTTRTISLKTGSGSKVKSLTAGKVKLAVSDTANTQNFHLKGPGVNKKTGVAAKAKATWTLTLKAGKYTYRSDKSRKLHGSFTVKAAG